MRKKMKMRAAAKVKKFSGGGSTSEGRNAPVGANAGRAIRRAGEFFTTVEGVRPTPAGTYGMTYEEELEAAARSRRDLEARRAERAAARRARPSLITNNPVGNNNAANAPAAASTPASRSTRAAAAAVPAGAVASASAPATASPATPPSQRGRTDAEREAERAQMMEINEPAGRGRPRAPTNRGAGRTRESLTADDLNAMVLDRLGASYSGRAIPANAEAVRARGNIEKAMGYKKGGRVAVKKGKK